MVSTASRALTEPWLHKINPLSGISRTTMTTLTALTGLTPLTPLTTLPHVVRLNIMTEE